MLPSGLYQEMIKMVQLYIDILFIRSFLHICYDSLLSDLFRLPISNQKHVILLNRLCFLTRLYTLGWCHVTIIKHGNEMRFVIPIYE
jgi:hypothetical protein